jgi:hypothetical protein
MKKELNWKKHIGYVSQNITSQRKKSFEFEKNTLDIIKKYNSLDIKLYEWIDSKVVSSIKDNETYIKHELEKLNRLKLFKYYKYVLSSTVRNTLKNILKNG